MSVDINPTLAQLAELFDQALMSDDQRVKDALRALLTVTVLCSDASDTKALVGPFKTLIDDVTTLKTTVSQIESRVGQITRFIQENRSVRYGYPDWTYPEAGLSVGYDPFKNPTHKYYK